MLKQFFLKVDKLKMKYYTIDFTIPTLRNASKRFFNAVMLVKEHPD